MWQKTALMLALLAPAIAACAPQGAAPAPAGANEQPKQGGIVKFQADYDFTNLDPSGPLKDIISNVAPLAYNSLLGTDAGPDIGWEDVKLIPELAERWEVSADAKSYSFTLRQGVKFQNTAPVSGREMTSADVARSYEYLARHGVYADKKFGASRNSFMFEGLDRIDTPDKYTVVVRFKEAFAPFLVYAADDANIVAPVELIDMTDGLKDHAIGTGAFVLDKAATQSGTRTVFKRNPDYWRAGQPYLNEVHNLILNADATAEAAFVTKQLDIIYPDSHMSAENLRRTAQNAKFSDVLSTKHSNVYINTRVAPLNDVRVRKAFSLAINRDEIIKNVFGGTGEWALSGAVRGLFTEAEIRQIVRHDVEEAKKLVAEAGYKEMVDIEWLYTKEYGDSYESRLLLIQSQMKKANINLIPKVATTAEVNGRRRTPDQHQITASAKTGASDLGILVEQGYLAGSGNNYSGVNDAKVNQLLAAQRAEADPAKRRAIIREVVKYVNGDMAYGLGLTYEPSYIFWQADLNSFYPNVWGGKPGTQIDRVWRGS